MKVNLELAGKFQFELDEPAENDSFFVFALHKSGSVLLNTIVSTICAQHNIQNIDLPGLFFSNGYSLAWLKDASEVFREKGYCYSGFRAMPGFFSKVDFSSYNKILLVRDPRDMLVSYYYSMLKSHGIPERGVSRSVQLSLREKASNKDIDSYVLEFSKLFVSGFNGYKKILNSGKLKVYRYEDVIFDKRNWIVDILNYLDLTLSDRDISDLMEKIDIFPDKEDETRHVRQVSPGNYKAKLKLETIEQLNEIFAEPLNKFKYI